jgi:hypothetical protein
MGVARTAGKAIRAHRLTKKYALLSGAQFTNFQEWGSTTGNAATVAHSTKRKQSGKDSVI